ncbi:hypothetical protein ABT120_45535 [Nonomuraea angiospora]|uniref:hypothetical protein n=1 Tax=Nonomuraea angiospora TaxID=46172 RepID=UPI0033184888
MELIGRRDAVRGRARWFGWLARSRPAGRLRRIHGVRPAPNAEQLDRWVKAGELRYVLSGSGQERMVGGRGSGASRTTWITSTCEAVPASEYGGTE